jgi:hypothetical protein
MCGHCQRARDEKEIQVLGRCCGERVAPDLVESVVVVAEDGVVEVLGPGVAGGRAEDSVRAVSAGNWWVAR